MSVGSLVKVYLLLTFMVALINCFDLAMEDKGGWLYEKRGGNQHYPYKNQLKRSNAEFMNGLLQMDLDRISEVGKRSNAEFINGLIGMNLKGIHDAGRKR